MGLAVSRVPANTTQSKAIHPRKDCFRKMGEDRWLQIVLEHKPKCQICRGRLKGSQGGGGWHSQGSQDKASFMGQEARQTAFLRSSAPCSWCRVLCWALRTEKVGSSPPWGFGDREVHSVMVIQGDACSNSCKSIGAN